MAEVPKIDERVRVMIDWLVDKDLSIWYQVVAALERRLERLPAQIWMVHT